jgi:NMD protein affecting ribosome stability and mRNA decay
MTMTGSANQTDYVRQERQDRLILELEHDPYHSKRKIKGPAVCPDCGAVYKSGRWTWEAAATDARDHICPACHRISDRVPAAFLTIRGEFLQLHKDEVMNLIRNYEARERQDRPLKRIMDLNEQADRTEISFTDAHLARGIGEALHSAYEGTVDYRYTKGDIMLRVTWTR